MKILISTAITILLFCGGAAAANEADSLLHQGDTYFLRRDFPAAIRSYKDAAEINASPEIYQKLGDAYLASGNDDDALGSYQKSLKISPDDAGVHYSAGVILERKGNIDGAVAEYERCIILDKNNGDAHRRLADIYALKGELQKSVAEYQKILVKAPDNPVIHFRLAKVCERAGKYNDAKASLEMAIKLDPLNLEPRRELIKLEIKRKNLPSAEKLCREILAINRDDKQERKRLIGILGKQMKYEELAVFLTEECSLYPGDSKTYYRLGIVKDYQKDYRPAIQAFLKSIEIKPTSQSYHALARTYLRISETTKAREALIEANRLDPKKKGTKELIELIDEERGQTKAHTPKKKASKKKKKQSCKPRVNKRK